MLWTSKINCKYARAAHSSGRRRTCRAQVVNRVQIAYTVFIPAEDHSARHESSEDENVSRKTIFPLFIIFFAGLAAAVAARTYFLLCDIDPNTGFYYSDGTAVRVFNIFLAAVTIVMLLPLFSKKLRALSAAPGHSTAGGIFCAVLAVAMLADSMSSIADVAARLSGAGAFFSAMLEVLAAICFMLLAWRSFGAGGTVPAPVALLPVFWAALRLMSDFMHYTTVINVSAYLYDMLKMVFVMIFLYYFARYAGSVPNGHETRGMLAFGLPAALFCSVSVIPRWTAYLLGAKTTLTPASDLVYMTLAVYIVWLLVCTFAGASRRVSDNGGRLHWEAEEK